MVLREIIYGAIGATIGYAKTTAGAIKAIRCDDDGQIIVGSSALPTGAATNTKLDEVKALVVGVNRSVQLHANIDFSSASAQTIIAAPAAGNRIRLCQLVLISGAASPINSEVAIKSGSTTIKTVKGSAVVLDFPEHCNLGTAEALVLQATTADRVIGGVDYYVEAV